MPDGTTQLTRRCNVALKTIVNGIDVGRQATPGTMPDLELTTTTEWLGGTQTRTWVAAARPTASGAFMIDADYPDALLGSGAAPSPNELFLAALGSSFVASFVLAAAAEDVRIEFMRVVASRVAVDEPDASREPSVADVHIRAEVDAEASFAHLEQLIAIATERSPVVALCRPNVRSVLTRVGTRAGAMKSEFS